MFRGDSKNHGCLFINFDFLEKLRLEKPFCEVIMVGQEKQRIF
jgi:hypothetical protein